MNDYIVNPSLFYWISVISNLSFAFGLAGILGFVGIGISKFGSFMSFDDKPAPKISKKLIILLSIFILLSCALPSKETMYTMVVAKQVTYSNLENAQESLEHFIDYTVDKVKEIKTEE